MSKKRRLEVIMPFDPELFDLGVTSFGELVGIDKSGGAPRRVLRRDGHFALGGRILVEAKPIKEDDAYEIWMKRYHP